MKLFKRCSNFITDYNKLFCVMRFDVIRPLSCTNGNIIMWCSSDGKASPTDRKKCQLDSSNEKRNIVDSPIRTYAGKKKRPRVIQSDSEDDGKSQGDR